MKDTVKKGISILIPTYNFVCKELVSVLHQQAEALLFSEYGETVNYEIIVADDGSIYKETIEQNQAINNISNCKYIVCEKNRGRAGIRNYLAKISQYDRLLFLDSDMNICNDNFLKQYVDHYEKNAVDGGVKICNKNELRISNLRYKYEKSSEARFSTEKRNSNCNHNFHTANFFISRKIMLSYPFDERFNKYGYEDVLLGKTLEKHKIIISHIDNPALFDIFEDNISFLTKTEEGLRTLYQFRHELLGYSTILNYTEMLKKYHLCWAIKLLHKVLGQYEKKNLIGTKPSLTFFKIYKLGYYLSLNN
jgi:glycosyltransferase involved in cell wall biosynthesis